MLNKNILPKKLPYVDQFSTVEDCVNYMVKTINSSFVQPVQAEVDSMISPITLDGVELTQAWSVGGGGGLVSLVYNHSLGVVPTKWIIVDHQYSTPVYGDILTISRSSWTTTQITLTINTTQAASGNLRILVLR